jgi:transposase
VLVTPGSRRILAYRQAVDLRKSIDGLVGLVKNDLQEDVLSGSLFIFFNKRGTYLKLVMWDRTGFCLFAKRLEHGKFVLPGESEKLELSSRAFELILDGIVLGARRENHVKVKYVTTRGEGRIAQP